MNHPFDLDPAELEAMDLDFGEPLTDEEAAHIRGGIRYTTLALGEEGGGGPIQCISAPCPGSEGGGEGFPRPPLFDPPMTTMAVGEEGGGPIPS
ncbi:hypothetical protein [Microcoleus sp. F4-D5]|uniref:hypothetical protein n=1 Tax=Microcoleus sp. F4-D5 TaxID=2818760 RepID=UPI002FD33720